MKTNQPPATGSYRDDAGELHWLLIADERGHNQIPTVEQLRLCGFVPAAQAPPALRSALETIARTGAPGGTILAKRNDGHSCQWCRGMHTPCPTAVAHAALAQPPAPIPHDPNALVIGGYAKFRGQLDSARWKLEAMLVPGDGYDGSEVQFRIGETWYNASGLRPCEPADPTPPAPATAEKPAGGYGPVEALRKDLCSALRACDSSCCGSLASVADYLEGRRDG